MSVNKLCAGCFVSLKNKIYCSLLKICKKKLQHSLFQFRKIPYVYLIEYTTLLKFIQIEVKLYPKWLR